MIYPNGSYTLSHIVKEFESGDFAFFYSKNEEPPEGWDWKKDGIYRSPHVKIETKEELLEAISNEANGKGCICYCILDSFFKNHPYEGESVSYVKPTFFWEYSSPYGKKRCYKIRECSYLGKAPKHVPLSLECFSEGFSGTCISIGSWERDSEGYEFRSVGSRLFEYVDEEDLPIIWKAIKDADKFLSERYLEEDDDEEED